MKKLLQRLKLAFNYGFYSERRFKRSAKRRLMPYYSAEAKRATNERKMVISMFDGRKKHGGLADRLRGMATTYLFCQEHGWDYRIHFCSPFRLEEFLAPNRYDWRIDEEQISYNLDDARPVYIATSEIDPERDKRFQRRMAEKFFRPDFKQLHAYTNMRFEEERFSEAFHTLFRPQPWLQELIDRHVEELGGKGGYIAISTRFMELLGDFNESADRAAQGLPAHEQQALLEGCGRQIERIHAERPSATILVTSDSARFIDFVTTRYDYVRTLPGEIGHIDVVNDNRAVHTKTFLDFLVLAEAAEHFYLVGPGMYRGNFSRRAAQITDSPFHEVIF